MGDLPSIELLESGHVFPGPYMFKLIGRTENGFVGRAVAAVRDALAAEVDPPYSLPTGPTSVRDLSVARVRAPLGRPGGRRATACRPGAFLGDGSNQPGRLTCGVFCKQALWPPSS